MLLETIVENMKEKYDFLVQRNTKVGMQRSKENESTKFEFKLTTEFGEPNLPHLFFSSFSRKGNWNSHVFHVVFHVLGFLWNYL